MAKSSKKSVKDGNQMAVVSTVDSTTSTSTPAKAESKSSTPSLKSQVETFIRDAGTDGCTVNQIASGLNLIDDNTDKVEAAKIMKKLRVQARSVCGGAASNRSGRQAVYILPN